MGGQYCCCNILLCMICLVMGSVVCAIPVTGVSEGMDGCVIWSTKTLKFISVPVVLKHLFRCLKLYLHHIQQINWSDTKRMQIHMQIGLFYCEVGACVLANPTLHIWPAHVPALQTWQFICHFHSLEPLFVDVFYDLIWCFSWPSLMSWRCCYKFVPTGKLNYILVRLLKPGQ